MAPQTKNQLHRGSPEIPRDTILKVAKEITVKFIEVGKITPATFELCFKNIYSTIDQAVTKEKKQ